MKKFRSGMTKLCGGISYIGMFALLFATAIQVIDVILSLVSNLRVSGTNELVALMMVIMMFLTFGKTQLEDAHVRVDMFTNKFPPKVRCTVDGIVQVICVIFAVLMAFKAFQQIGSYAGRGYQSEILGIPFAPFAAIEFIGFLLYAVCIAITAIEHFKEIPNAKPIEM
ncbi:MAG: TRAP transporter small permease [Eubacterium sp.]|nr:TRAP transporter small permease [Eubacterium sp.]